MTRAINCSSHLDKTTRMTMPRHYIDEIPLKYSLYGTFMPTLCMSTLTDRCIVVSLEGCCWKFEGKDLKSVDHTSPQVVHVANHPLLVHNRCVIKHFSGVFVSSLYFLIFCSCRVFCHRTESDLFPFLLEFSYSLTKIFLSLRQ